MPSKDYLDYVPLIEEEKTEEKPQDKSGFVTKDCFELVFGFSYPKVYARTHIVETIKYPKTDGSNGKISRFR